MKPKNILFIGMGAIGSLYASKCVSNTVEISCVARSDKDEIQKKGIRIIHPNNDESIFYPKEVFSSIKDVNNQPDYIVITTKVLPNQSLVQDIKPLIGKKTCLVLLQNGIHIETAYQHMYPDTPLISGLAFVCVAKIAPATIHHQDYGRLILGLYPQGTHKYVTEFAAIFDSSDISCKVSDTIQLERYKKLIWNAPFNPLSVIYKGKTTQELLADKVIKERIIAIMKDVQRLAASDGYKISDDSIKKNIDDTLTMKPYKTSMCLDWEAGRPLETDAILGNAIQRANDNQCDVPELRLLYDELSTNS